MEELFTIDAMQRIALAILTLALIAAAPKRPEIVTIQSVEAVELPAAGKGEVPLELTILKGYHIQANPASETYLIATTVKVETTDGIHISEPSYPKGVPFKIKDSDKEISTYEGKIEIRLPLQADESAEGERTLKGAIRYQGCDATTCFPPTIVPFEAKVKIKK